MYFISKFHLFYKSFKSNNLQRQKRSTQHSWDSNLGVCDSCLFMYTFRSSIIRIIGHGCKHSICLKFIKCSISSCGCLFCGGGSVLSGSSSSNIRINGSGIEIIEANKKVLVGVTVIAKCYIIKVF